jgi:hypothetical protein
MMVSLIPREHVSGCWESVEGHLAKAAEYTYGRFEVGDILDAILDYDYNLWIAFDDDGVHGAVVTKFMHYPRRKYLDMVFTGGERLSEWKDPMLKLLQAWAFDNGCDGIESTGRPGWAKIFANDGHKVVWHTYELPAADAGLGAQNG